MQTPPNSQRADAGRHKIALANTVKQLEGLRSSIPSEVDRVTRADLHRWNRHLLSVIDSLSAECRNL